MKNVNSARRLLSLLFGLFFPAQPLMIMRIVKDYFKLSKLLEKLLVQYLLSMKHFKIANLFACSQDGRAVKGARLKVKYPLLSKW